MSTKTKFQLALHRASRCLKAFGRDDDGAVIILGLMLFVAMILVSGIAVDIMRYESQRQQIQSTADRAVIAATMLRGNMGGVTPEQIARNYFEAEGLGHLVPGNAIQVNANSDGSRTVTISPQGQIDTMFMRLVNVPTLDMSITSQAIEGVGALPVEIVLVLDVSGSMMYFDRMRNLREAAVDFVNELLADNSDGRVAITIVPYSTEVILPTGTLNLFGNVAAPLSGNMTDAFCSDFLSWSSVTNSINTPKRRRNCDLRSNTSAVISSMPIRPYFQDAAAAAAYINTLEPNWGTSIDLGLRMGALFFDPTIRPIISHLVAEGEVPAVFEGRPLAWEDRSIRALVLMTDGENCCFHANHAATRKPSQAIQDADTVSVCDALKAQRVMVYGVAFEAPPAGAALMENCASSPNHYFNSSGEGVINAFRAIASHVQTEALRLTQ